MLTTHESSARHGRDVQTHTRRSQTPTRAQGRTLRTLGSPHRQFAAMIYIIAQRKGELVQRRVSPTEQLGGKEMIVVTRVTMHRGEGIRTHEKPQTGVTG